MTIEREREKREEGREKRKERDASMDVEDLIH